MTTPPVAVASAVSTPPGEQPAGETITPPPQPSVPDTILVLGIGNVLWADEGFGVRCVEALDARYVLPSQVRLVDGGTQGMYLLDDVCSARRVLVFDAIDYKLEPGTLKVLRDTEVPVWSDTAMSLHQATFQELLSLALLRDRFPERVTVVGVQPAQLEDLGGSLSEPVRARLDEALQIGVAELAAWGAIALPRAEVGPDAPARSVDTGALCMARYEAERPDADAACRIGDDRFLNPSSSGAAPDAPTSPETR